MGVFDRLILRDEQWERISPHIIGDARTRGSSRGLERRRSSVGRKMARARSLATRAEARRARVRRWPPIEACSAARSSARSGSTSGVWNGIETSTRRHRTPSVS